MTKSAEELTNMVHNMIAMADSPHNDSADALRWTQAALNAANALLTLQGLDHSVAPTKK